MPGTATCYRKDRGLAANAGVVLSVLDTYTALTMLFFGPQFRTGLGKTRWLVRELWQYSCIEWRMVCR